MSDHTQRNQQIYMAHVAGNTAADIAQEFGLSQPYVRQLIREAKQDSAFHPLRVKNAAALAYQNVVFAKFHCQ
ncbi:hypothetical protein PMI17_01147 [Pantoea sp. GM01]|nr:hypothetical protein PMI17_01147 [Pantoea sp. GM01]